MSSDEAQPNIAMDRWEVSPCDWGRGEIAMVVLQAHEYDLTYQGQQERCWETERKKEVKLRKYGRGDGYGRAMFKERYAGQDFINNDVYLGDLPLTGGR